MRSCGALRHARPTRVVGPLLCLAWLGGCVTVAPPPPRALAQAPQPTTLTHTSTIELRPQQPGVMAYGDDVSNDVGCDSDCQGLRALLAAAKLPTPLRLEPRLNAMVAELTQVAREDLPLDYEIVEFLLSHLGIAEPTPHLFLFFSEPSATGQLAASAYANLEAILKAGHYDRFGVSSGRRGERTVVAAALQQSRIQLERVPRQMKLGGTIFLEFRVAAGYRNVDVLVSRGDGSVVHSPVVAQPRGRWSASVRCPQRAERLQLEVNAEGAEGAVVLANFPVWCGAEPPSQLTLLVERGGIREPAEAEQRIADLIARDRRAHGVGPVTISPELAAVARRYSDEMARTGVVAHRSVESGEAQDRLRAAGIVRALVMENLARAGSAESAHHSLMNSPGHRGNILSPEATEMGIGVAIKNTSGANEIIVTELFARVPPPLNLAAAQAELDERFARLRGTQRGARLAKLATEAAVRAAAVGGDEAAVRETPGLSQEAAHFERLRVVLVAVSSIAEISPEVLPDELQGAVVGFGLAQGEHARLGPRTIYCVVLFGRPRAGS